MKALNFTSLFLVVISLVACASIEVKTNHNPSVDLAKYKTVAWKKPPLASIKHSDVILRLDKATRQAINQNLLSRGYQFVATETADIVIDYNVKIEERETTMVMDEGSGYGPQWEFGDGKGVNYSGMQGPDQEYYTYEYGVLTVRMIDAQSNGVVWESIASKVTGSGKNYKNLETNVDKAVAQMFKRYPSSHSY